MLKDRAFWTSWILLILVQVTLCYNCSPDDEFGGPEYGNYPEFDDLMDSLNDLTFGPKIITANCTEGEVMTIRNETDPILWDLRFKIYSERVEKSRKTLDDCYRDAELPQDCIGEGPFKECLKQARVAMLDDLESVAEEYIRTELAKRCPENKPRLEQKM